MTRSPNSLVADVVDNAMLYKDMTQWLRNRTFLFLFFGLLVVAEVIIAFVVLAPPEEEAVGSIAFGFLSATLALYAGIIAFQGHNLTAREFHYQTFELYELSGMSLEKMVWGKMFSMLSQFFFGFFCLIPFMFVSFMLGGLDFYLVVATTVCIAIAVLPLYLLGLFLALLSKNRQLSGALRVIALVFVFILFPYFGGVVYFEVLGYRGGVGPVDFFKLLLTLDPAALRATAIFLAFYAHICLLLFYACCNAISPSTDSRAAAIHFLVFLLVLSFLSLLLVHSLSAASVWNGTGYFYYVPLLVLFLIMGLGSYYNRLDIPIMALKRQQASRWKVTRLVCRVFHGGSVGACKTLSLIYGLMLLSWVLVARRGMGVPAEFHEAAAFAAQAPYFLAFPGILVVLNRNTVRHMPGIRAAVLAWWVVLGLPLLIMVMMSDIGPHSYITPGLVVMQGLAVALSPLSAVVVQGSGFIVLRVFLGMLGLFALWWAVQVRAGRESAVKAKATTPGDAAHAA